MALSSPSYTRIKNLALTKYMMKRGLHEATNLSWYSLGIMVFSHYAVGGEHGSATYSVEFEPLVGLLIVVPDRSVVLVHHNAWAAPVQMHVDH